MEDMLEYLVNFGRNMDAEYVEARFRADTRESMIIKNGVHEASLLEEDVGMILNQEKDHWQLEIKE